MIRDITTTLRPQQWIKNLVVFAGPVFGGVPVTIADAWPSLRAFVAFCAASSAIYLFNDVRDRVQDRLHPVKRRRPVAVGRVAPAAALAVAAALGLLALGIGYGINQPTGLSILAYLALLTGYSVWLKARAVLDVVVIAIGFQIRAITGALAVDVPISGWLLLCTFLLSLFLGFAKRRNELIVLGDAAARHRPSLQGYDQRLLDGLIGFSAGSSILVYAIYTLVSTTAPRDSRLELTVPFVAVAIIRYCVLVYRNNLGGAPEALVFRDRPLFFAVAGWAASVVFILRYT